MFEENFSPSAKSMQKIQIFYFSFSGSLFWSSASENCMSLDFSLSSVTADIESPCS